MQFDWFCVRTLPRRESTAAASLSSYGVEVLAPVIETYQRTIYRTNRVVKSLFPPYIFARLNLDDHYYRIRKAHGVHSLVSFDGSPYAVPIEAIEDLKARMDALGFIGLEDEPLSSGFSPGDAVAITAGSFFGQFGVFKRDLDGGQRVMIMLKIFGQEKEIPFSLDAVRPLALAAV